MRYKYLTIIKIMRLYINDVIIRQAYLCMSISLIVNKVLNNDDNFL